MAEGDNDALVAGVVEDIVEAVRVAASLAEAAK
jgi:hypothetical protein